MMLEVGFQASLPFPLFFKAKTEAGSRKLKRRYLADLTKL